NVAHRPGHHRQSLTSSRGESRRELRGGDSRNWLSAGARAGSPPVAETRRPRGAGNRTVRRLEQQNYSGREVVALDELAKLSAPWKASSEATHSVQKA